MSSGRAGDPARGFDPGNSFTEESLPAPNPSELPSWLKNFAEMAADAPTVPPAPASASDSHAPASIQTPSRPMQASTVDDDAVIPGWFDTPVSGANTPTPTALTDASPIGGADFFSEDDLPEWLRALNTSPSPEGSAEMGTSPSSSSVDAVSVSRHDMDIVTASGPASGTLTVPAVTRIWITEQDVPEPSAGASIFAEIAQVVDLRPDVLVSETPASVGPQTSPAVAAAPVTAVQKSPRSERSWGWTFRLAVLLLIILAVIGLVYMNLAA